jgi:hypothetical protein
MSKYLETVDCPVCGKTFIPACMNVYKITKYTASGATKKDVCSYSCMNMAKKSDGRKRKN